MILKAPVLIINIHFSELCVALFDPNLSSEIAENISKSIRLFCNSCEEKFVVQGPDATQVIGEQILPNRLSCPFIN